MLTPNNSILGILYKYCYQNFILRCVLLSLLKLSKSKVGFRFITVEAYAVALGFYMKNNFITRVSDKKLIEKLDIIKKQDPERCFNIYLDLKDIKKE